MDEVLVTFSLDKYSLLGKCKAECMLTCPAGLERTFSWSSTVLKQVKVSAVLKPLFP